MRLSKHQQQQIKQTAAAVFGHPVVVILFGSRVDDSKHGGDIDIMIKTGEPVDRPAVMAAKLAGRLSRLLEGRKVDVVIQSDSLKHLPIHDIAERTGIRL
jgi:predicted nucleotidyltransferase